MPLKSYQAITAAEEAAERLMTDAYTAAKKRMADAEQKGSSILERAESEVKAQSTALLLETELKAVEITTKVKAKTDQDIAMLMQITKAKNHQAVQWVVESIVHD